MYNDWWLSLVVGLCEKSEMVFHMSGVLLLNDWFEVAYLVVVDSSLMY